MGHVAWILPGDTKLQTIPIHSKKDTLDMPKPEQNEHGEVAVVQDRYKRIFDLAVTGAAIVLLFPFWLMILMVISAAIWLEDRGPILYSQERPGLGGKIFRILKFRTKQFHAQTRMSPENVDLSTKTGVVLRRFHLDEIPQIINVLKGDMSLVGPRPEWIIRHRRICQDLPEFNQRLRVRPGIAGLAQIRGDYWLAPHKKLRYDNLYIKIFNPWIDMKLLFFSFWYVINREVYTKSARNRRGSSDVVEHPVTMSSVGVSSGGED